MIIIPKSSTSSHLTFTLKDDSVLLNPNYLVVLESSRNVKHRFILLGANDISSNKNRYNTWLVNPSTLLSAASPGEYNYKVYEQASSSNTDETGLTLLEEGKLKLTGGVSLDILENNLALKQIKEYEG